MVYKTEGIVEEILVNYRWIFVLFLLPISFVYDVWTYFRNWYVFKLNTAPKKHSDKVRNVQKQIRHWIKLGGRTRMCTARPSWQTIRFKQPQYKKKLFKINVNLVDVLEIDTSRKIVTVEPMVTMGQLTATLNPLGWTIPVLPEIDDLTVGGLVMGTGIESTSHREGLFQHICVGYELVLSDGSVVRCSKEHDPDLFYSIPWSYGTLGILTAVDIKLVPAKKYVKLTYHQVRTLDDVVQSFTNASNDTNNDVVEGIMFGKTEGVLMIGNFTDVVERNKLNSIGKWYKPWFFKHVESMLKKKESITEYIPLREYYHRHTKSIFWELQDIVPFGNNFVFRFFLGWLMPPKISLLKLTQVEAVKKIYENNHVIQDMLVPIRFMKESILKFHEHLEVYPLWLCPFALALNPGMIHPATNRTEMYVDIGAYGVPKASNFQPTKNMRTIEKFVTEVNGFQMLYADTYTDRVEFRRMFDHSLYDRLRDKLNCCDAFPEVYDKVSKLA